MLQLFGSRRFWPLFITQFFGAFNDNALKNAFLIWVTYDAAASHNLNTTLIVTAATGLFILPLFLLSATAGQVVDKYQKSLITRHLKGAEVVLMLASGIMFYMESVIGLLALLFFMGAQSAFFGPIKYSLLPQHLTEKELATGNGLIEGGTFIAILLGTMCGGLAIRTTHGIEFTWAILVTFSLIGWASSYYIPPSTIGDNKLKLDWNIAMETWRIMKYIRKRRAIWLSVVGISWFWFVGASFLMEFPIYTQRIIGGNEHVVTLFLGLFSVGVGAGSLICSRLLRGDINGKAVPYASIGMTLAIALFVLSSNLYEAPEELVSISGFLAYGLPAWGIIASLFLLAMLSGIYIVPLYTMLQHYVDKRYLARAIAANNILNALFMVIASIFVAVMDFIGLNLTNILLAVGIANLGMLFFIVEVKSIKGDEGQ